MDILQAGPNCLFKGRSAQKGPWSGISICGLTLPRQQVLGEHRLLVHNVTGASFGLLIVMTPCQAVREMSEPTNQHQHLFDTHKGHGV